MTTVYNKFGLIAKKVLIVRAGPDNYWRRFLPHEGEGPQSGDEGVQIKKTPIRPV